MIQEETQASTRSDTTLTLPSERELVISRTFAAPRAVVFEATTKPEHVRKWWGPRAMEMVDCQIDFRVGGSYRYAVRTPDGMEVAFSGVYKEIEAPARIVHTEGYEAMPGHDYLSTVTYDEKNGHTTLTVHLLYQTAEDRDGHIASGMESGMRETWDRLAELVETLA